ncbi:MULTISPECIES: glycoside hydrolase family 3 protein [unclassified Crossiella]|uniref:beta-glucosidase n=1 Tax=unclassified Crossiella TaxID=2620835 RepID=UPI001FFF97A5|nr:MULTISPECIES: glycoside hydrolase family 3 C-terminal domain-containing protein [unclassified Crossiella]MCK2245326.1 glycoside hydrolase family 3 C-terminal domain-containing protein [Crossiella sp. S99.2]MCK2258972.1 glycoside hydrolase family 3 C-terminal domain-containing protein [Crossiella sp. S99.1]
MSSAEEIEDRLKALIGALDLPAKVRLLTGADAWGLPEEPRIGLRRLVMTDGPAGARGAHFDERDPSAHTPSPTALAATWDTALVHRIGLLLAEETRAKGAQVLLAPTINLHRSPLGGRHFECFSEDPLLVSEIGLAYVRGVQAGGVAACAKHFVANDSENQRFTLSVDLAERALRELYLAPFETVVRAGGVKVVMAAYNAVRGTTMTENHPLQVGVLKGEWGFAGPIVSDWTAARSTADSATGGLDLVMPGPDGPWGDKLVQAVRDGEVAEAEIDDKVLRLLRLAADTGVLDGFPAPEVTSSYPVGSAAQTDLLREAATRGMVLLRNENNLLPLAEGTRIALIGPNAAHTATRGGGSADLSPRRVVSFAQGLGLDPVEGVRPGGRQPLIDLADCTNPHTGEPGFLVEYSTRDGDFLGSEHRETARLAWLGLPEQRWRRDDLRVIMRAHYRPRVAGTHTFGVTALGPTSLTVNGHQIIEPVRAGWGSLVDSFDNITEQLGAIELSDVDTPVELVVEHLPIAAPHGYLRCGLTHRAPGRDAEDELAEAVRQAAAAEVAVVVVGTNADIESESHDRTTLELPPGQDELIRRVAAANPRTVVVVNAGSPVLMPWADQVAAVLYTWFPGQEAGHALADVLHGRAEPGGRLPTTFPRTAEQAPVLDTTPTEGVLPYPEGLLIGYRAYDQHRLDPAFCFGHGLGYTTWDYRTAHATSAVSAATLHAGEPVPVRVTLTNTGARPGREIVQVYLGRHASRYDRPPRVLAGFAVAEAGPGETLEVEIRLAAKAFAVYDEQRGDWAWEHGSYLAEIGRNSRDLPLTAVVTVH